MTTPLTERYIDATMLSLGSDKQADVRAELAASIADAIDVRVAAGDTAQDAERAVLTELGDPAALAAGYADRPLHLIGPRYYLTWLRLLRPTVVALPLLAGVGSLIGQAVTDATFADLIGTTIGVVLSTAVHVAFWVTVVFVVLERTGTDAGARWTVDALRDLRPNRSAQRAELIASLIFLGIAAAVLAWDRLRGIAMVDGEAVAVLDPSLTAWAIGGFAALLAGEALFAIILYTVGRWTVTLAVINTAIAALWASLILTLLGRGALINPELIHTISSAIEKESPGDTVRVLTIIVTGGISLICAWDIADGWIKTARKL